MIRGAKFKVAAERSHINVFPNYKDEYFEVKPSKYLQSLGVNGKYTYGLYARQSFDQDDVIMEYKGIELSVDKANAKRSHTQYLFAVRDRKKTIFMIDSARASKSSAARYANSTLTFEDPNRNSYFVQWNKKIFLKASRAIKRGDEIIAFYGQDTEAIINHGH